MKNRGVSLVELLVVIGILSVLLAIVASSFSNVRKHQVLQNAAADIVSILRKAQGQALASVGSSEYGVHFDTNANTVTLFKGVVYNAGSVDNEVYALTRGVTMSNVSFTNASGNSNQPDVLFYRLFQTPNSYGSLSVIIDNLSKTITVSKSGGISYN